MMLSVKNAQQKIIAATPTIAAIVSLRLKEACGRVLATSYRAKVSVPPADNSAMDGYAVNSGDINQVPMILPISQRITPGLRPHTLAPGTAARIFTGAEIPEGADAVIIQERCEENATQNVVVISERPQALQNIRTCGQDIQEGQVLYSKGHLLRPQDLGLLASAGIERVNVIRRPSVAILSTGNELQNPGQTAKPGHIYNSNGPMLATLLELLGCAVYDHGIVEDDPAAIIEALEICSDRAELVISSGGASVGEEDHMKAALSTLGEIDFWKVQMKPGKPLMFGRFDKPSTTNARKLFMGLPGNPVSAFVCYVLFCMPAVKKLQGRPVLLPQHQELPLGFDVSQIRKRPEYMRVRVVGDEHQQWVEAYPNQSSGVLMSVCWANALALIPENTQLKQGDTVRVYPIASLS